MNIYLAHLDFQIKVAYEETNNLLSNIPFCGVFLRNDLDHFQCPPVSKGQEHPQVCSMVNCEISFHDSFLDDLRHGDVDSDVFVHGYAVGTQSEMPHRFPP